MHPLQLCDCGECKRCKSREKGRRWRSEHPDYNKQQSKQYRDAHREASSVRRRAYYVANRERILAVERKRRERVTSEHKRAQEEARRATDPVRYRALAAAAARRYRERHREKVLAQARLQRAVKAGKIERQSCEVCGASPAQGHHDDYGKPLDVRWLCPKHHTAVHMAAAHAAY